MKYTDFTDQMIADIVAGRRALTEDERAFLLSDTPHFEECSKDTAAELPTMSDADLIRTAFNVWAEYAQGQTQ